MTKRSHTVPAVDDEGEVRRSVLAYLHSHPQAADTLNGIVHWWLRQQRYESSCVRIGRVLDQMVTERLLRRDQLPGGEALYALNQRTESPRH